MTVKELIEQLRLFPDDTEVWLTANAGEYLGAMGQNDINLIEIDATTGLSRLEIGT